MQKKTNSWLVFLVACLLIQFLFILLLLPLASMHECGAWECDHNDAVIVVYNQMGCNFPMQARQTSGRC